MNLLVLGSLIVAIGAESVESGWPEPKISSPLNLRSWSESVIKLEYQTKSKLPAISVAQGSGGEIISIKDTLAAALGELDEVRKNLERETTAHSVLSVNLTESASTLFRQEIGIERGLLEQLTASNNLIRDLITVAVRLANGEALRTNYHEVGGNLRLWDQNLSEFQRTLESVRQARQFFELRLGQFVQERIATQPAKIEILSSLITVLDPQNLESNLQKQRTIISTVASALETLK